MTADPDTLHRLALALEALNDGGPRHGVYYSLDRVARWLPGRTDDNKRLIRARCPRHRRPGSDRDYYLWEDVQRHCMETLAPETAEKPAKRARPGAPPKVTPITKPRGGRRRN